MQSDDLVSTRERVLGGADKARHQMLQALEAARGPEARHAFLKLDAEGALAAADAADARVAAGGDPGPLAGLAVSIKDLFDVRGQVTTAGSTVLAARPAAVADAPAVARLRAAGAALIGRTNMTEFAYSGVGLNPHHGTPANVPMARLGRGACIPGGSTSGGAVSVACGAAWAALGSDTGGSIRIPAALQGLVGFKNTQRLTPADGSVPLAPSLDTSCAITRSARDAVLLHEVLAARRVVLPHRPLQAQRLAVINHTFQDDTEPAVAAAFERAVQQLARRGASVQEIALPPLREIATLHVKGGLAAAESWAWHRELLASDGDGYDPRVKLRIAKGAEIGAAEYEELKAARGRWIDAMLPSLQPFDAVLSPTVPLLAPPIAALRDDAEFFRINGLMLRNTSVVNQLDGCAISLPCHRGGDAPVGLMLWTLGGRDDALLDLALAVEAVLREAH